MCPAHAPGPSFPPRGPRFVRWGHLGHGQRTSFPLRQTRCFQSVFRSVGGRASVPVRRGPVSPRGWVCPLLQEEGGPHGPRALGATSTTKQLGRLLQGLLRPRCLQGPQHRAVSAAGIGPSHALSCRARPAVASRSGRPWKPTKGRRVQGHACWGRPRCGLAAREPAGHRPPGALPATAPLRGPLVLRRKKTELWAQSPDRRRGASFPRGCPARRCPQGTGLSWPDGSKAAATPGFVTGSRSAGRAVPSARPGLEPRGAALRTRPPTPGAPVLGPCGVALCAGGTGKGQAAEGRGLPRGRAAGQERRGEDPVGACPARAGA